MGSFTLSKAERLSKEKLIKELFDKGSSFYLYPFKILYLANPDKRSAAVNQLLITVSSRQFKRAVDRNLIKRRIREAYRLQKEMIRDLPQKGIFSIIYTAKEILPFAQIRSKVFLVLEKIKKLEVQ
ncbi:MAG: ribonuclease P protein component [Cyclobacteriaceae bacterium]|nr:ribonuclease P protein component [Cyclobacteriaceae bacterium]